MKNQVIVISMLLCIHFLILSCDKIDEYKDKSGEKLFDKDEIFFTCSAKDTIIHLNGTLKRDYYFMDVYDDVSSDSVVSYNGLETGEVHGDWFSIFVKGNKLNIKMEENHEDHDRQIRMIFFRGGLLPIIAKQSHCQ